MKATRQTFLKQIAIGARLSKKSSASFFLYYISHSSTKLYT